MGCLSKIPELGDTVFLILKRKPVRFLQWYHHATVMLFCWLALSTEYMPGLWFAATNYFVHSGMYMYFCLMTFKLKPLQKVLERIAPFITIIQITQMVWGLIVNGIAVGTYFSTGNCQIKAVTVYAAVVMYFGSSRSSSSSPGRRLPRRARQQVSHGAFLAPSPKLCLRRCSTRRTMAMTQLMQARRR